VKVISNKKVIGVLPKIQAGSEVKMNMYIPHVDSFSKSKFHLEFSTSQNIYKDSESFIVGDIQVSNEIGSLWKLFTKPDGSAFGVNSKLFLYKDNDSILTDFVQIP
jgi:hypothetical protein